MYYVTVQPMPQWYSLEDNAFSNFPYHDDFPGWLTGHSARHEFDIDKSSSLCDCSAHYLNSHFGIKDIR